MENRQLARNINASIDVRDTWIDRLCKNPFHEDAPIAITRLNAKIDMLVSMWDWSDESTEMPVYYARRKK